MNAGVGNNSFFVSVSSNEIDEVNRIQSQVQQHDARLLDVRRLAAQLGQMKGFPHNSSLRFLGYFALLESLLTHAPKPSDPYDSITRQLRKKVALLNNRWPHKINYNAFGNVSPDTIWTKIYKYRSKVAHGGNLELTGNLTVLKNHDTALRLVKDTVKAVIRHAFEEPQLLIDLRDC